MEDNDKDSVDEQVLRTILIPTEIETSLGAPTGPSKTSAKDPVRSKHIAAWQAKRLADIEKRRKPVKAASKRRVWRHLAGAAKQIEIPQWVAELSAASPDPEAVDSGMDISIAPGCFGLAMTYKPDAKECVPCPFHHRCKVLAAQNWLTLKAERAEDTDLQNEIVERETHDRLRNRMDKAKSRARINKEIVPKRIAIDHIELNLPALADRKAKLTEWLARDEPRSRQLRKFGREILIDYVVFQNERKKAGKDPGPTSFADALTRQTGQPITASSAQKRLARLCRLETAGGPWVSPRST